MRPFLKGLSSLWSGTRHLSPHSLCLLSSLQHHREPSSRESSHLVFLPWFFSRNSQYSALYKTLYEKSAQWVFVVFNETHSNLIFKDDRFLLPYSDRHGVPDRNRLQIAWITIKISQWIFPHNPRFYLAQTVEIYESCNSLVEVSHSRAFSKP